MGWRSKTTLGKKPTEAERTLAMAYRDVFKSGIEETELVLTDLATFCGFYQVQPPGLSADERAYFEGQRSAFARIFHFLSLPDADLAELEKAARIEAAQTEEPLEYE